MVCVFNTGVFCDLPAIFDRVWNSSTSANEVVEKCEDELIVIKKDRVKKKKKKQKEKINGAVSDFEVKTTSTPNISDVNINCPNWEHYNENDTQTHKNTNSSRAELEGKKNKKRKLINQFDENVASENETLKIDEQNLESIVNPSQSKSKVSDNVNKKKELKDEETFKETCDIKSSSQKTLSHIKTVLLNSSQIIGSHQKQSENESKFLKNANKKSDGDLSDTESFEYNCLNPNNKFTVEDNANSKTEFENQSPTVENADHEMVFETNISNLAENTNNYSGKTDCDSAVEIKPFRHSSSVGALLKAMNTMSDTASEQSFVTKRKRQKRVRKRKSKKSTFGNGLVQSNDYFQPPAPCNSYNGVSIENTENTSLNIKNSKTVKGPNTHIKFEDEDDEVIASIVIAEAEQKVEQKTFDINLTEDDLEKYPLMNNLIPRNRDIIAFKVRVDNFFSACSILFVLCCQLFQHIAVFICASCKLFQCAAVLLVFWLAIVLVSRCGIGAQHCFNCCFKQF